MKKTVSLVLALSCALGACVFGYGCKKEKKQAGRYEITAEYVPETATLAGTTKFTYENNGDNEISVLKFQLYPNAYRKDALYKPVPKAQESGAYYQGESYGEMVISSVNGAKNWEVMGEDENVLYAYLERSLFPGDKVVLDIGFLLKLANVNHRTGVTKNTVNLGNFFPILCGEKDGGFCETAYYQDGDPFLSETAEFKVTLKAPKDYMLASTGETLSERTLESKKEYELFANNVRDFALVLSDKYRVVSQTVGETELCYYYYQDENAQKTLETVAETFTYYEETFGAYPYAKYTLAQTGLCMAGQEYPCLSMLSDAVEKEDKARAIAHEVAHQWWYGVVGSDQIENAWQDEGVAEYSAIAFFENYEKYGITRENAVTDALKEYRSYYDVYGSVLGRTDTKMSRHLKDFLSEYEYQCLSQDKAVVMLDTLRKSVGDKKFFTGLKKYYSENKYKIASIDDFVSAFEKTGLDVQGFFDSFLQGKAIL